MKIFSSKNILCAVIAISTFGGQIAAQETAPAPTDYRIAKGRYYGSLNFSMDTRKAENEDQLIRQVVDQNKYEYRVTANGGYAIRDNMTLGLSAGYGRSKEELTTPDENENLVTTKKLRQGYSIAPNMRNYIPLGNGRVQVLVQTEFNATFGDSLQRTFRQDDVDKVEGKFVDLGLGVSPGMLLFFNRNWAFETMVGLAGFSWKMEEKIKNGDVAHKQKTVESGIDLRLNLLQLKLGVAYYF